MFALGCDFSARSQANADPLPLAGALGDGLADADLAVAVGEGRETGLAGAARADEAVKGQVELLEGVGEALGVTAGEMAGLGDLGGEQRRVAVQERIGTASPTQPEQLGSLAVPDHRAFGAADFQVQPVLPAGVHLHQMENAPGAAVEMK